MVRQLTLKYNGACVDCERELTAGEKARWIRRGEVTCADGEGCRIRPGYTTGLGDDQNDRGAERLSSFTVEAGFTKRLDKPADGSSWGDKATTLIPLDKLKDSTVRQRVDQSVVNVLLNNLHATVGALKQLGVDITYRIGEDS